ncbi:MAG: hypothetical protein DRH32_09580 [Deltaproteobacteria bacterium]|nr:MAG: hypothetical protein DRH32_09580 [Deltaproteobacteria bacterium]
MSVAGIRFGFQTCGRQHIFIFLICANPRIRVLSFYHFFPLIDHDVSGFIPGRSVRLFCAVRFFQPAFTTISRELQET